MKKLIPLLFVVLVLVFVGTGCGGSKTAPTVIPTEVFTEVPTPVPTETPTPVPTETPIPQPSAHEDLLGTICDDVGCNGDAQERPATGMMMVYVPAGEFEMGSTEGDDDAQPVHTVALDGFWIDSTEVTYAQYQRCEEAGGCERPPAGTYKAQFFHYDQEGFGDHPIQQTSWEHAAAYCAWAGGRLPTEAEWEYAARGPEGYVYPWGDSEPDCDKANYQAGAGLWCVGDSSPVGSHPTGASWCGAQDMAGNVAEWVADSYAADTYATSPSMNPTGPSSGSQRVVRGGGAVSYRFGVRSYARQSLPFDFQPGDTGFRCAKDAD